MQGGGTFNYDNESDTSIKQSTFYAIDARYLKIIGLSGYADDYMAIAELEVYQDLVCSPTGQDNQLITFEEILAQRCRILSLIYQTFLPVSIL